jgi:hypothetical protein
VKRWVPFLLAVAAALLLHESLHALCAALWGELAEVRLLLGVFPEVVYGTPVSERRGSQWAVIAGTPNLATIAVGYLLLALRGPICRLPPGVGRNLLFYLSLICLVMDPLNLFVGPLVYGGDAEGIAAGLEIRVEWVQGGAFLLLLTGRELAARALFPFYETGRPPWLFRPLPVFHRRS